MDLGRQTVLNLKIFALLGCLRNLVSELLARAFGRYFGLDRSMLCLLQLHD